MLTPLFYVPLRKKEKIVKLCHIFYYTMHLGFQDVNLKNISLEINDMVTVYLFLLGGWTT